MSTGMFASAQADESWKRSSKNAQLAELEQRRPACKMTDGMCLCMRVSVCIPVCIPCSVMLKSGKHGVYPDLEEFTKKRIMEIKPESLVIRETKRVSIIVCIGAQLMATDMLFVDVRSHPCERWPKTSAPASPTK